MAVILAAILNLIENGNIKIANPFFQFFMLEAKNMFELNSWLLSVLFFPFCGHNDAQNSLKKERKREKLRISGFQFHAIQNRSK